MENVLLDSVVRTDYGQFELGWGEVGFDGDWNVHFEGQVNGLVGAARGRGLYVNLARRSGGSSVRVVRSTTPPGPPDSDWEDVVEVSVTVPDGTEPMWCTWAGEGSGPLDLPPSDYRVRVSARGRDAGGEDELAEGVVDFYLIQFWPAAPEPDAILRVTSQDAQYWHREVGNRR